MSGGDAATAVQAIVRALESWGMVVERREEGSAIRLDAERKAGWRDLVSALPQRATWLVEREGDRLAIAADFRPFRRHGALLLGLAPLFVASFEAGLYVSRDPTRATPGEMALGALLLFGPLLFLVPWALRLLAPLGGRPAERIWNQVLKAVGEEGKRELDHSGAGFGRRHTWALLALFGIVAVEVGRFWFRGAGGPALGGAAPVVAPALAVLALLLVALVLMVRMRGFQVRAYPLLGGIASATAAALALLAATLPWWLAIELGPAQVAARAGRYAGVAIGFSLVIAALAVYLFLRLGLGFAPLVRVQLARLGRGSEAGIFLRATESGPRRLVFQAVFGLWWALLGLLLAVGFGLALAAALDAIHPGTFPRAPLAAVSIDLVARALGRPAGPVLSAGIRGFWIVHAGIWLAALAVSVGDLAVRRRRARARLREGARAPHPARAALEAELARLARGLPIRLAFVGTGEAAAAAHRFGLFRSERYVAVASDLPEDLAAELLVAVLAHEVAHHALGHGRRSLALHGLGRLSFVGDGFVRAIQDSFGNELRADAYAVEQLGIRTEVLSAALAALGERSSGQATGPELPAAAPAGPPVVSRGFAWDLFWSDYRGASNLRFHYYHPVLALRRRALAGLREGTGR